MKILAIDTSSKICSVAITEDEKTLIELHNDDEKTHSVKLMPMINEAFKRTGLTLDNIALLACSVGPGSFTGIRIGIATIKAFADVKNIPVVGVNSLESLAYNLFNIQQSEPSSLNNYLVCSLLDARNSNVYSGCYTVSNNQLMLNRELMANEITETIQVINDLIENNSCISKIIFVGDAACLHKELLQSSIKNIDVTFLDNIYSNANSINIAKIAIKKYLDGDYGDSSSLSPLYLRKSQAERALEEKKKNEQL